MEIILRESIDNLGRSGEVVQVKAGYARNYLLPQKLAYPHSPGNLKLIEGERNKILLRESKLNEEALQLLDLINGLEVRVVRKVSEKDALYGSVTAVDIVEECEKKGFSIEKQKIHLKEPIRKIGLFDIKIQLSHEVVAEIKLRVDPEG